MLRFRRLHRFFGTKRVAFLEACIIGAVSGLAAVALKQSVEVLTTWRLTNTVPAWILLPLIGVLGGMASGWLLERVAPEAAGSGIPNVKAALAYVDIPLNLRVALTKLGSTILALGAGLSLGRQGPTVQIGAALAAQLSQWVPTSPEYRRQLIAAGAAAGLAAGFNAPIAGVLFVVEELLQDFSNLTLGTAILASFVGAVVSRLLGGQGLNLSNFGIAQTGLSVQDLPFLVLLGVLAGIFGGIFSKGIFTSLQFFSADEDGQPAVTHRAGGGHYWSSRGSAADRGPRQYWPAGIFGNGRRRLADHCDRLHYQICSHFTRLRLGRCRGTVCARPGAGVGTGLSGQFFWPRLATAGWVCLSIPWRAAIPRPML